MAKYYKEALKKLKEEYGPPSEEIREANRARAKVVNAVKKLIKQADGPVDVPTLAQEVPYDTQEIFYAVNFLLKYGGVHIVNKRGEYPQYAMKGAA